MKPFLPCVFLGLITALAPAALSGADSAEGPKHGHTIEADVSGMVCQHCVMSITRILKRKAGIRKVFISVEAGKVIAAEDPDNPVSDAAVREAIEGIGFGVTDIRRLREDFETVRQQLAENGEDDGNTTEGT